MLKTRSVAVWALTFLLGAGLACAADRTTLATVVVQTTGGSTADRVAFDGVVEAVRQTSISAQVAGAIVALQAHTGDRVAAGQELLRLDARAASQNVAASMAQADAARAAMTVAEQDYTRQKQLFQKQYISQAALERAQAQLHAAQAQLQALQAQSAVAQTQSRYFVVQAPYAGVVSDVPVALGDMAMPGRTLVSLYDPMALRIAAAIPANAVTDAAQIQFELPGLLPAAGLIQPTGSKILPMIDAATHTAQVQLGIPSALKGVAPGMFARVWIPVSTASGGTSERLFVPASSVVQRAEVTGLYVVDSTGQPVLRQVRLGRTQGSLVEVLSGVRKGERIAADPQAAAKVH